MPFLNQEIRQEGHFRIQSSPEPHAPDMIAARQFYNQSVPIQKQIDNLHQYYTAPEKHVSSREEDLVESEMESKYTGKFKDSMI